MSTHSLSRAAARAAGLAALAAGAIAAGSCVSERSTSTTSVADCITPPAAAGLPVVFIKQFTYVPAQLHVSAGARVAWVNCETDGTPHTVTADDASFNSGLLNANDVYIRTIPAAGAVPYHCDLHPFMKASVIAD
jgi:plastocyanin